MSNTHKALVLESFDKPIVLKDVTTPTAAPGSALVKVLYVGVSNLIRALSTGKTAYPLKLPQTLGASAVGRVEAIGHDAVLIKEGDVVWIDPTIAARDNPDAQMLLGLMAGMTPASQKLMESPWRDGTFAQKVVVPLENCHVLPTVLFQKKKEGGLGYQLRDMTPLNQIIVSYGGLESAGVTAGKTVIVAPATGKYSGGAVLAALAMGAKVIAAGRNEDALKKLKIFPGAKERLVTVKLVSDIEQDSQALLAATGGIGAHVYINFTPPAASGPTTPAHITSSINALKFKGQALVMGGLLSDLSIPYLTLMLRNITVRGQFMYTREQAKKFLAMLENGNLIVGEGAGLGGQRVFGLEEMEDAITMAEKGGGWGGDVVLAPNGEEQT